MQDQDWTYGYVTDVNYTPGFYRELSPTHLNYVMNFNGMRGVDMSKPFNYCELGFGQGITLNMMAASHPHGQFYGTDFNPSQATSARSLASEANLENIYIFDDSFQDFLNRDDLPKFDFITLHGIYSWISYENRKNIVEFIRKKLKYGGIVYVSYNCLPGWARNMPLRQLMVHMASRMEGNTVARINASIEKTKELAKFNPAYFQISEGNKFIENIENMNRSYLAHEYFNLDWTPQYFYEVAEEFKAGKLEFVASANAADGLEKLVMPEEVRKFIGSFNDMISQETIRDYLNNQQFRRDIFTRGVEQLSPIERVSMIEDVKFIMQIPIEDFKYKVQARGISVDLKEEVYQPIMEAFNESPHSLNSLLSQCGNNENINPNTVYQSLQLLFSLGYILPGNEHVDKEPAKRLQNTVIERNMRREYITTLPAPIIGNGININASELTLLKAVLEKHPKPAEFLVDHLMKSNRRLVKDGKPIESREDNITQAQEIYQQFEKRTLHLMRNLQMI